jgi:hypothetical protein
VNLYLISKVHFSSRIIHLSDKWDSELRLIFKRLLLIKLGLGINFLRNTMYSRVLVLGLGLVKSKTVLVMLAIKLYLANTHQ